MLFVVVVHFLLAIIISYETILHSLVKTINFLFKTIIKLMDVHSSKPPGKKSKKILVHECFLLDVSAL